MKNKMRWIPGDMTETICNEYAEVHFAFKSDGCVYVIGYGGKRTKHDFYYSFPNEARARKYAQEYLDSQARSAEEKAKRRAGRNEFKTSLVVGSILYTSWGWEQTNVEWFQVVEVSQTGKTVVVREIAGNLKENGFMSGNTRPCPGQFVGEPMVKHPAPCTWTGDDSREYIRIDDVRTAYMWDGRSKHCSWYG